jgi:small subunit ribosomal protein S6
MPLYESVLIARSEITPQQAETIADTVAVLMTELKGEMKKREYWGLRSLSYRIKKNRKGHYLLLNLEAPPAAITEMERQLALNEDVLRFMTVRVEELEEGPSAILQRRDRDERDRDRKFGDRPDRGDRFGGGDRGDRGDRPPRGPGGGGGRFEGGRSEGGRFDSGRAPRSGFDEEAGA